MKRLNAGIDMSIVSAYNFFVTYLDNPQMKKIKEIDGLNMYGCKVKSMMSKSKRYIFAFIRNRLDDDRSQKRLADIKWCSLHMRTLDDYYDVPQYEYSRKQVEDCPIIVFSKNDAKYDYKSTDFPIIVSLLYGKFQTRIYSDKATLPIAIEEYNTIISFQS